MAERDEQLRNTLAQAMQPAVDWSRYNQPFGELKGTAPEDTPVVFQTRNGVKITEGDIRRSMDVGMGAATVGGPAKGIKAYHSSPHDFDRFDLAKIGTGEGAQSYGHGLYFSENPAVSGQGGQYWQQFLRRFEGTPEGHAASKLQAAKFDREAAINDSKWNLDQIKDYVTHGNPQTYDEVQRWHRFNDKLLPLRQAEYDALASGKPVGPRTYEVNINADPAHMLDWDKGLHRQSPEVQQALTRFGIEADMPAMNAYDDALYNALSGNTTTAKPLNMPWDPLGSDIYRSRELGRDKLAATMALREAGIPGIKYLDQGSRNAGTGSSNYVIFDPNKVRIDKKYGIAAGLPIAGAAAAAASGEDER